MGESICCCVFFWKGCRVSFANVMLISRWAKIPDWDVELLIFKTLIQQDLAEWRECAKKDDKTSMSNHPKAYGTAAVTVAFVAGILLTLGFKALYPDLERRYQ